MYIHLPSRAAWYSVPPRAFRYKEAQVNHGSLRQLRTMNPSHPVGVYFETENIYTLDPDSNQMLTMHAMLADWESANKSRRMILSYDQRICTGQYPVADLLGYKHTIDGNLLIEEEGAKTVKFIFYAFISGMTCEKIARILTEKKRPTLKGRTDWNAAMVRNIMQNERRWGDLDVRKTIVIDYVKGKTVLIPGSLPSTRSLTGKDGTAQRKKIPES